MNFAQHIVHRHEYPSVTNTEACLTAYYVLYYITDDSNILFDFL